jgi:hypothetical protein
MDSTCQYKIYLQLIRTCHISIELGYMYALCAEPEITVGVQLAIALSSYNKKKGDDIQIKVQEKGKKKKRWSALLVSVGCGPLHVRRS